VSQIKAAFFDRDGTLIYDVPFLSNLNDIKLIPSAVHIARLCQQRGYRLFMVTNQSGVARGLFGEAFVQQANDVVCSLLAAHGVVLQGVYYCPHHPVDAVLEHYKKDCLCRKPYPGMLMHAAQTYNIDLKQSLMFGDRETDWGAGRAAGCTVWDITQLFALPPSRYATLLF